MSDYNPPLKPDAVHTAPTTRPELATLIEEHSGPGARKVLRCRTVATGYLRQLNYVRDLPPYTIEQSVGPASGDAVPAPAEAMLPALGSCIAVAIQANAIARGVPIRDLNLKIEAEFDPTAAWGVVNVNPARIGFDTVHITARLEADAPREVLQSLLSHVVLWSPLSNTLYNPVHLEAVLGRPQARPCEPGAASPPLTW